MFGLLVLTVGLQESSDEQLIRQAKRGDRQAFGQLVRRYQKRVYALCRRLGGSHDVADDLTQEAFIKAYQAIGRFDEALPFWNWIGKRPAGRPSPPRPPPASEAASVAPL